MGRILVENLGLQHIEGKTWMLTARPPKGWAEYPGFALGKPAYHPGNSIVLTKVKKSFEPQFVQDGVVPAGVTPKDLVTALKKGETFEPVAGVTIIEEPDLTDRVLHMLVTRALVALAGVKCDVVTNVSSSRPFATLLGKRLAESLGVKFIEAGVVKSTDPERLSLDIPDEERGSPKYASSERNLSAYKKKLAAGQNPSLKTAFYGRNRSMLKGFLEPSSGALDAITDPNREHGAKVVVVDDAFTTGSTGKEAKRELEAIGYEVVAFLAAFQFMS